MPVQIIFAGKAHPADEPGKLIIQQVYRAVKDAKAGGRLVFLEDYDMNLARYLVQGVDVWMNTPRRPNEASGTSGMKAAMNGVLNFSVLDGWWREGYNGHNGWAIGDDTDLADANQQDEADAESLYDTLENEIIPLYYAARTADGLPHGLDRAHEGVDPHPGAAVHHAPHAQRIHDPDLPAGPAVRRIHRDRRLVGRTVCARPSTASAPAL